jgi:hypothetical protein
MGRRAFLNAMSLVPLTFIIPKPRELISRDVPTANAASSQMPELSAEQTALFAKIEALEADLRGHSGFSWYLHNELRHYCGKVDEAKSLAHADAILAHSIMDSYILNTLSDWHYDQSESHFDPRRAVTSLIRRVDASPDLQHLQAASTIRIGDIVLDAGEHETAYKVYQRAIESLRIATSETLTQYRLIAASKAAAMKHLINAKTLIL